VSTVPEVFFMCNATGLNTVQYSTSNVFFCPYCSFCGIGSVETEFTTSGFDLLELCFDVETGVNPLFICVNIVPAQLLSFLEFKECDIRINDRYCNSCTVCEGNRDFTIDCSNININPIPGGIFLQGPKTTTCFGFGAFLGI